MLLTKRLFQFFALLALVAGSVYAQEGCEDFRTRFKAIGGVSGGGKIVEGAIDILQDSKEHFGDADRKAIRWYVEDLICEDKVSDFGGQMLSTYAEYGDKPCDFLALIYAVSFLPGKQDARPNQILY